MNIRFYEGYLRNRSQLCEELGIELRSGRRESELAVLTAGYLRWGRDIVHHLYGAFGFAVWDEDDGTLFCARDHFGIQSFYYSSAEDGRFLCGGELSDIVKDPHYKKSLDRDALQLYMMFGYPVGEKTLYEGVLKLMPGCTLVWDGKAVQINRYYSLSFQPDLSSSEEEWIRRIDQALQDTLSEDSLNYDCADCMTFLSGGVDSSYLLASSGIRDTVGIGCLESGISETPAASAAAETLGARLHALCISAEDYFRIIPTMVRNYELPLADTCSPAFALGCEHVAGNARAFLSGEGPDEFFSGYNVHRRSNELGTEGAPYYGCDGVMDQKEAMELIGVQNAYPVETLVRDIRRLTRDAEPLTRMLAVDISLWLEGDILFSACRSARGNGIDLLLPFVDRRIFEISAAIPSALKRKYGIEKYILRRAAETRLPHEIAFRPKKGFPVPARQWFREERFRSQIEKLLFGDISAAYFDQRILRTYWDAFLSGDDIAWKIPYAVYIFVIWYETCFK